VSREGGVIVPFCPRCKFEYTPKVSRCPECGSELVAELPPEPERGSRREGKPDEVVLCTVQGEIHASLLRGRLEAEGIPSRAQLGGIRDAPYYLAAMPGPVGSPSDAVLRIYVRRVDLSRAQRIYRAVEKQ